jgi:hypothetical protein
VTGRLRLRLLRECKTGSSHEVPHEGQFRFRSKSGRACEGSQSFSFRDFFDAAAKYRPRNARVLEFMFHSALSVMAGSMRDARAAGIQQAAIETASRSAITPM